MPIVPNLRSCYAKVGRLYYFGRMLDKIRLQAAGQLPLSEYGANLGKGFDSRTCKFLRVSYDDLKAVVLAGKTDEQVLAWTEERGGQRSDEECEVWNDFMMKRGWRDASAGNLAGRIRENGFDAQAVLTLFDYIDLDEGRDAISSPPWQPRKT